MRTEFETSMVGHIISVKTCGGISKPTLFKFQHSVLGLHNICKQGTCKHRKILMQLIKNQKRIDCCSSKVLSGLSITLPNQQQFDKIINSSIDVLGDFQPPSARGYFMNKLGGGHGPPVAALPPPPALHLGPRS